MPVVIAGLVLSFLVMMLFGGTEIDRTFLYFAAVRDAPGLQRAAAWLSDAAAPNNLLLAAMAASIGLALLARWRDALLLLATTLSGRLLVDAMQALAPGVRSAEPLTSGASIYPSEHAAGATVAAFAIAFIAVRRFPMRAWALAAAALFALASGASRIVIEGDWPSDVIGGWALGLAWTLLVLLLARMDLGDGTPRPLRHSFPKETKMSENPRTETARRTDDKEIIEAQEEAPAFNLTSGGTLQRDVGSRAEAAHEALGKPGTEGVRDSDKKEADANLPRFNER